MSANRIAKWDGVSWSALGSGVFGGSNYIKALTVFDDGLGGGPALCAGGNFTTAGGVPANWIAKWNGLTWSALGNGMSGIFGNPQLVGALAVLDDGLGGGPALYAGGYFTTAGGVPAKGIAKWNGVFWSPLGSGFSASSTSVFGANSLAVFDDGLGGGPLLYAGGQFTTAGGVPAINIAKWNGVSWAPLAGGTIGAVTALTVFDDGLGGGPALYAGGPFTTVGGVSVNHVARWKSGSWAPLGSGLGGQVEALTTFEDGSGGGQALYAGGIFTTAGGAPANYVAKWNGVSWSALGSGLNSEVQALTAFNDGSGSGPALYTGGNFTTAGGAPADHIARWNGDAWSAVEGIPGLDDAVNALTVFDDGAGDTPALYAGGSFTTTGEGAANRIAKWNGVSWAALGSGLNSSVYTLTAFHDDSGGSPSLYAGGSFTTAGGVSANRIARWNGDSWAALGSGVNDHAMALTVFDDGSGGGPALYAGGFFTEAAGMPANHIAKWDDVAWSALGSGLNGPVRALTVFDDGSGGGPALYAGGSFTTAGGVPANRIAKWDGVSWSPLGIGVNDHTMALTVFDDGSGGGPALYAGGFFTEAAGMPANRIAKWDGVAWSPLGIGLNDWVTALTVFDDGSSGGPGLFAGGTFTSAGSVTANQIAKWDGVAWSAPGSAGMNNAVHALAAFTDGLGGGPALYAGGSFTISATGDVYLAKWQGCAARACAAADFNCDGDVDGFDLALLLGAWGRCPKLGECPADLDSNGIVNGFDLAILLAAWG